MIKFQLPSSGLTLTLLISAIQGLTFPLALMAQSPSPLVVPPVTRPGIAGPNRVLPPNQAMPQPTGNVAPGDNVPNAKDELQQTNLDDIRKSPDQLTTWVCKNDGKTVAVEIKEIDFWQNLTEENKSWQCSQDLTEIPGQKPSFSCEPTDTMGLISVYWLEGKGGQAQMKSWMTALANNRNLVCTTSTTNQYWE